MRIKGPGSQSEIDVHQILMRALGDSGWTCSANVSVQQVLDKEDEWLDDRTFNLYSKGSFDFAVYDDAHYARFAVEVDGFGHLESRQVARDLIKNELCAQADLPLLGIGSRHLAEPEETSVLEWLVSALVMSDSQQDDAVGEDEGLDDYEGLDDDESVSLSEDDADEEENFVLGDPGIEMDHPFPDNALVEARLLERHGIGMGGLSGDIVILPAGARYVLDLTWPGTLQTRVGRVAAFAVSHRNFKISAVSDPRKVLHQGVGLAAFAWANRVASRRNSSPSLAPIDFPWDAFGVAGKLAQFDALRQTERWAAATLRR